MGQLAVRCCLVVALGLSVTGVAGAAQPSAQAQFDRGMAAFERGALEQAAENWAEAARSYEEQGQIGPRITALTHLAQAQAALGRYGEAAMTLGTALELAEKAGDQASAVSIAAALGNVHIALGPPEKAEAYLRQALDAARKLSTPSLTASTLNDLGNFLATQGKDAEAMAAYREGLALAKGPALRLLRARTGVNAANALRRQGAGAEARALLDRVLDDLHKLGPSHEVAFALVGVGTAYRHLRSALRTERGPLLLRAAGVLSDAGAQAEALGDRRTSSYAWGYLGGLYEEEGRYADALDLTRRAVFAAQQVNAPQALYRWQWQTGRLLRRLGRRDEAIEAYRRAVYTLQGVRPELSIGYGVSTTSFRDSIGRVYFELVDLLLERAHASRRREDIEPLLIEARETVELFKVAELRDYFRDDCVDTALSKVTKLDVLARTAVVIYPILLSDRTELLVSLPGGLKSVVVPVGLDAMTREVRLFRRLLEKRTTRQYLPHAQKLYDWLVRPLEPDLAATGIDTLVFVPDGPLRTVPMAALHDGKQFLVEKYATGITPGLNLTDPRPIQRQKIKVLAVGLTEPVQGFPPLPSVAVELDALKGLFDTTTLVNKDFVVANFAKELKEEPFTIVHVASHGQFEGDAANTFLLAFDGKLTMNRLDQFIGLFKYREEPLELLTLSACETAAGDDRAALGLAGIAIKAGARSAVATFWEVQDKVAAELVTDFYRALRDPSVSRAGALQRAQLKVLGDPRFRHPGFWAPFVMINSWL